MKQKTKQLDFTLETDIERRSHIKELLNDNPNPSNKILELYANYILYGKDEKTGNSVVDDKKVEISTKYSSYASKTKVVSLEKLLTDVNNNETVFCKQKYSKPKISIDREKDANIPNIKELWKTIDALEDKLKNCTSKGRKIIAIEGVYSMSGNIAKKEIFDLSKKYNTLLIVDEAHSSGVIGENLLGIFDYYNIKIENNHIKMGTLGKAYGSYGAYILSSKSIIEFLQNRAKPIIYSTAPSLFDTALGYESLKYILRNKDKLKQKIKENLSIIQGYLGISSKSLIIPILVNDNKKVLKIQKILKENGFLVGAIRQPTVKNAIVRLIAKIDINCDELKKACNLIKDLNANK